MSKKRSSKYYWQSAKILLHYKKLIALSIPCVLIQSVFFSATIPAMVMIFTAFFADKEAKTVTELCHKYIVGDGKGNFPELNLQFYNYVISVMPNDMTKYSLFLYLMAILAVVAIIGTACNFTYQAIIIRISQHSTMRWRDLIFKKYVSASMEHMTLKGSSDYISRILNDTMALARGHNTILGRGLIEVSKGVACFIGAIFIDYKITLISLISIVPIAITLSYFGRIIRRASKRSMETYGQTLSSLNQTMTGLQTIKIHNAEGFERRHFRTLNRNLYRLLYRMRIARALSSPLVELLAVFTMIGVLIFVAQDLINTTELSGNEAPGNRYIMVLGLLAVAGSSIKPMSSIKLQIKETDAAAQRILESLEIPTEPTSYRERHVLKTVPRHTKNIIFKDLAYHYPNADVNAVDGVDLNIEFGQSVAIVGGNGSGKTTLLSHLPRLLLPTSGQILIDDQDIANCNLKSLRSQMSIVSQQTVLFEASIAENIAYGNLQMTREQIIASAKASYAHEFIEKLPNGYDTMLGEGGNGLSGGQKQRISIARAILRNPAIMILDEATSQIDADSESKITQALHDLKQGRTTFIIAHRLSTIVDSDMIIVMEHGKIIDQGKHQELLDRCETYQVLTSSQMIKST